MPPVMDFCKLETNRDHQSICKGCREIEMLFEVQRRQEHRQSFRLLSNSVLFHSSFQELDFCARKCVTCRVFRQALLLKQRRLENVTSVEKESSTELLHGVHAQLVRREATASAKTMLKVSIGRSNESVTSAKVACLDLNNTESLVLPENPDSPLVHQQAKKWLDDCKANHPECSNLSWSSTYPTRLLHILSDSSVELMNSQSRPKPNIEYIALSYCWGSWNRLTKSENQIIQDGKTTKYNLQRRSQPFDCSELPATIQDSIAFTYHLGIKYMWIDTLCIVQDDEKDWQHEAALMHEVYGNASFTLCVSSSDNATEGMFKKRDAWSPAIKPCRLYDQWITTFDVSLNDVRADSPLANRAWTLQEERLSPRILYWSSQRMYWSCSVNHHVELGKSSKPISSTSYRLLEDTSTLEEIRVSQSFLISCRKGQRMALHDAWLDVVQSYTRRELSHAEDRFPALSGLASRYYQAQKGDEYLAGLWRKTLAEDLGWRVITPKDVEKVNCLRKFAPSWSWASLPFSTSTDLHHDFKHLSDFELLQEKNQREDEHPDAAIKKGGAIKCVKVRGRLRPFLSPGSVKRLWKEISRRIGDTEKYSFAGFVEHPAHSTDLTHCCVLSYEARKEEVLGQLDYHEDAYRAENGLLQIQCLEIGESAMLLLERCADENDTETHSKYLRVGISYGYREDFFADVLLTELELV